MSRAQFVDLSVFNVPANQINWPVYRDWSKQVDGKSRIAIRSSYGTGFTDQHYWDYRNAAIANDIDIIIHYHYSYPQYNSAQAEADWQHSVIGTIRPQDIIMLDMEEQVPQADGQWAYDFWQRAQSHYPNNVVMLYASQSYTEEKLQFEPLGGETYIMANWQFDPNEMPACPPPFKSYQFLQYSDRASIPGIPGFVDADVFIVPQGVPNKFMEQQAQDTWNMFSNLMGKTVPAYDTGIATAWKGQYPHRNFGSPLGPESKSVDWSGNAIVVQLFSGGVRCEWGGNGPAKFYDGFGNLLYQGY